MNEAVPKVSVLMGVRDGGEHLGPSVESILNQTMADFEFIIVDDGSTDGTQEHLDRYAAEDSRINIIKNRANLGLTRSLNRGLEAVRGAYVARQDADDISYPDRLRKQVIYLEQNPGCVALGSRMLVVDVNDRPRRLWMSPLGHGEIDFRFMNGFGGPLPHPTLMVRTNHLLESGGYDESLYVAQDMDLLLRLAEVGRLANLPDVLVRYRTHEDNISSMADMRKYECVRSAVYGAWERRGLGAPPFDRFPNPSIRIKEPSRTLTLMAYGMIKILESPFAPEGWQSLSGGLRRLYRRR